MKAKLLIVLLGCLLILSVMAEVFAGSAAVAPVAQTASVASVANVASNTPVEPAATTAPVGSSPIAPQAQSAMVAPIAPAAPSSVPPNLTNAVMPYYLDTNTAHWLTNPPNGNPALGYTNRLVFPNTLTNNPTQVLGH
jgi:hypothetical protein